MDLKSYSISPRKRAIALGNRFRPKLQRGLAIDERHSITVRKKFPEWGLKPQEHLFHNLSSLPDCLTLLLCSRRSEVKCLIRCVHDSPPWTQSKGPQRPSSCYLCRNSSARPREMASTTLRIASMRPHTLPSEDRTNGRALAHQRDLAAPAGWKSPDANTRGRCFTHREWHLPVLPRET